MACAPTHSEGADRWQADLTRLDALMNKVLPGTPEEREYLALLERLDAYESSHFSTDEKIK